MFIFVKMSKKIALKNRFLATLLASVYLFAVVFSGFFHTHTNNFKEDISSVKNIPASSKIVNFGGIDDCFSSHFFNASLSFLDSSEQFSFLNFSFYTSRIQDYFFNFSTENIQLFSLRAPPVFLY